MFNVFEFLKFLSHFNIKYILHLFFHTPHLLLMLSLLNFKLSQWITEKEREKEREYTCEMRNIMREIQTITCTNTGTFTLHVSPPNCLYFPSKLHIMRKIHMYEQLHVYILVHNVNHTTCIPRSYLQLNHTPKLSEP